MVGREAYIPWWYSSVHTQEGSLPSMLLLPQPTVKRVSERHHPGTKPTVKRVSERHRMGISPTVKRVSERLSGVFFNGEN